MANPKGNPGNKGGGRKSAYEERTDALWAAELWKIDQEVLKLQAKIQSRKYSARDMFALKCLTGNEKLLRVLADKMMPDKMPDGLGQGFIALELTMRKLLGEKDAKDT